MVIGEERQFCGKASQERNNLMQDVIHQFEDDRAIVAFTGLLALDAHIRCGTLL